MSKGNTSESAKIAVLLIIQRFSEERIFGGYEAQVFIRENLEKFTKGMLFKIKKFLLPTLIAISQYLEYEIFTKEVFSLFLQFTKDDIWGVRKVCVELTMPILKLVKNDDFENIKECVDFMEKSLNDSSRWVKN